MWYPLGRKCVEIHIFSPMYYTGLITPLEHIVCFQLLLSGKSVVTMTLWMMMYDIDLYAYLGALKWF